MDGKKIIPDLEYLMDYSNNPEGESYLDKFTYEIRQVMTSPKRNQVREYEKEFGISEDEQFLLLKFCINMGMVIHDVNGHRRKFGNRPYYVHPNDAMRIMANYSPSVFAAATAPLHDVIEEIEDKNLKITKEDLRLQSGHLRYFAQDSALLAGIGFRLYEFVTSGIFDEHERFYDSKTHNNERRNQLNSMIRVLDKLTRRVDEQYFDNLDRIFYPDSKIDNYRFHNMVTYPGFYKYLDNFCGIKRTKILNRFLDEVFLYSPSRSAVQKNRRRAMMLDLADISANAGDFEGASIKTKAKLTGKAAMVINQAHRLYSHPKRKKKSRKKLNKIMDQAYDLEIMLSEEGGPIDLILNDLLQKMVNIGVVGTPLIKMVSGIEDLIDYDLTKKELKKRYIDDPLDADIVELIDAALEAYKKTEGIHTRTSVDDDPFVIFAGTLDSTIGMLKGEDNPVFDQSFFIEQYTFFRIFQEVMNGFAEKKIDYISRLGTRYQKDRNVEGTD